MANTIPLENQFLKEGTDWEDWDQIDDSSMIFYNVQLREDICNYLNITSEDVYNISVSTATSSVEVYNRDTGEVLGSVTFKVSVNFD